MKCFQFSNGEKKEGSNSRKSTSGTSNKSTSGTSNSKSASGTFNSSTSTDRDIRRSGSEFNSQNVSDISTNSIGGSFPNFSEGSNNLRIFTYSELKNATRNFSRSLIIGEGGFGCVYRGTIKSSEDPDTKHEVAIKQLNRKGLQGHKEWLTEVNVLGVVEHQNLVKLIGYCADDDERGIQRLLVYELMRNRSVDDHLSNKMNAPLSWDMRLRIALDAARGLTYLHEAMNFQIIFRDLKTSNILLDENWNAKLSDFGLAREGPAEGLTHVSTAVVGTLGYAAPEYILTGRLTTKNDLWSYGIVLYELITGRRPMDRNRPKNEQKLVDWVKPYIADPKKFPMIIDPRIEGQYSVKCAMKLAAVANRCLVRHPKSRPKMSKVLEMVRKIVENGEIGSPQIPLRTDTLEEVTHEVATEEEELEIKRQGRRLVWWRWMQKLIRSH